MTQGVRERFTIRTSDRRTFRRCPRKWEHQTALRKNLKSKGSQTNINFWFGSAIHWAMEDFHGYNYFGDPRRAFHAYYTAFDGSEDYLILPDGAEAHYELGMNMLTYYLRWLERHNQDTQFETLWLKEGESVEPYTEGAEPMIEVSFLIDLDILVVVDEVSDEIYGKISKSDIKELEKEAIINWNGYLEKHQDGSYYYRFELDQRHRVKIVPVCYHGTIDRICTDKYGRWWLLDYKTAKSADTNKLDTDDQIAAYLWAVQELLGKPVYGFIYLQLTKAAVQMPKRKQNGELSVDKRQKTTYTLIKQTLLEDYGDMNSVPGKYIDFLNEYVLTESQEGDKFIRWDFVRRSEEQLKNTYKHIMGEIDVMLDPNFHCFINPTRDCIWDCPIRELCLAYDREDEVTIALEMEKWKERPRDEEGNIDEWKNNLKLPKGPDDLVPLEEVLNFEKISDINVVIENTDSFQMYEETEEM